MSILLTGGPSALTLKEATLQSTPVLPFGDVDLSSTGPLIHANLTVSGLANGDTISVADTGSGATAISVSGHNVFYGGLLLATAKQVGGTFSLSLTDVASVAAVNTLIHSLTFTVDDNPAATRTLTLDLDAAGQHAIQSPGFEAFDTPRFAGFDIGSRSSVAVAYVNPGSNPDLLVGGGGTDAPTGVLYDVAGRVFDGTAVGVDDPLLVDGPLVAAGAAAVGTDGTRRSTLAVGDQAGKVRLFLPGGDNEFFALPGNPAAGIDVGDFAAPTFFDVDTDGLQDLVIGAADGTLKVFRCTGFNVNGPTGFEALLVNPFSGITVPAFAHPTFVDLDGDGLKDLVLAGTGFTTGILKAWRNTGGDFVPFATDPFAGLTIPLLPAPAFTDLDGDGKPDLILGNADGTLLAYRNVSTSGVATIITVTPQNDPPHITSALSVSFDEFSTGYAYTATATDPDGPALFWSLGGFDAALFSIDTGGHVRFRSQPDYENPRDSLHLNIYRITVIAADGVSGNSFDQKAVQITVTNGNDQPTGDVDVTLQGNLLLASNTLADQDGLGAVGYAWQSYDSSADEWVPTGDGGASLAIIPAYHGGALRVIASGTDGLGNADAITSRVVLLRGPGNDTVVGDGPPELLLGLAGNDTLTSAGADALDGGGGRDVAVFDVARGDATLAQQPDGSWQVTIGQTTTLRNVEIARFTDGDVALRSVPTHDFGGTGTDQILWHRADGAMWQMPMTDGQVSGGAGWNLGTDWTVLGTGDFDGDGRSDILFRNTAGVVWQWQMDGTAIAAQGAVAVVDASWSVAGVGDFTGDGKADVLWQHAGDAALWLFRMDGLAVTGGGAIAAPGAPWTLMAVADLSGDGRTDLLWRNATTGDWYAWAMDGTAVVGQADLGVANAGGLADWALAGTGDFNGDGRADVLLRSAGTGALRLWTMADGMAHDDQAVADPGPAWSVGAIGDWNGDGMADILWREDATGHASLWLMQGNTRIGAADLGPAGTQWQVVG